MEVFWWLFVFVAWACYLTRDEMDASYSAKGDKKMTWYIVGIKSYKNGSLQLEEVDAVLCECKADADIYAKQRYRPKRGEELYSEACLTMQHINRAKVLHNQHALDDQVTNRDRTEFTDWMCQPAYEGDQDKYTEV